MSITEMQRAFGTSDNPTDSDVPKSNVAKWAMSEDLEVEGLLFRYLSTAKFARRITPPLSQLEFVTIAEKYLTKCIWEDPAGSHSHSRYEAGWEIANLFLGLWS